MTLNVAAAFLRLSRAFHQPGSQLSSKVIIPFDQYIHSDILCFDPDLLSLVFEMRTDDRY